VLSSKDRARVSRLDPRSRHYRRVKSPQHAAEIGAIRCRDFSLITIACEFHLTDRRSRPGETAEQNLSRL
jgi:hypothetical protein